MFASVDPPESAPNTVLVTSRWGGTRPTKCRFPVLCKCISKGTILTTMRLLKWREENVHVWRKAVWFAEQRKAVWFAEQSHRPKSTLYTLVTANTILTTSYLWKVYYVTVDPWFKTRLHKCSAGRNVNLRLDELITNLLQLERNW